MADGAGRLDKLSRLKSLRSGLKARSGPDAEGDGMSLDSLLSGGEAEGPDQAPAPKKPAPESPAPAPRPAAKAEEDGESLSAYFEALGIVPDGAKKTGATGTPPKPYAPPSGAYTRTEDKGGDRGRDVDVRDRWADPVREDDAYLSSFAGEAPAPAGEAPPPADPLPVAEAAPVAPDPAPAMPAPETDDVPTDSPDIPEADAPQAEAPATVPEPTVPDEGQEAPRAADDLALPDDLLDDLPEDLRPDFDKAIDIDAFEQEIAMADSARAAKKEPAPEQPATAESLSVTFDPERAAMLDRVSKQMGCSVDDVVVTAVDWYLDALLEEDGAQADGAGS